MHMSLSSIKVEKFRVAEMHLETIKALLEYKGGQEAFVNSANFLPEQAVSGKQMQMETYLGRYLSFSALSHETKSFKEAHFKGIAKQQSLSGITRMID